MTIKGSTLLFSAALFFSAVFIIISRYSFNNYGSATPPLAETSLNQVYYKIEYCKSTPRFFLVAGWAGLTDGGRDVITNIYLIDQGNQFHKIRKTTTERNDIVKKFHKNTAFKKSGFVASVAVGEAYLMTGKFAIELTHQGKRSVIYHECK
ncbi:hypothetical protein [Erwinia sp. 198]|uniref:hypothetical protein n=1 Tax=Erwinia sp. 198 TaxID=2022746 RepID=UPI000F69076C|nr:hypothetical protein [Erwinia sp. 198]RRZ94517.1 hypothetical protein EGK14_05645 [Erwinia sp. 198]